MEEKLKIVEKRLDSLEKTNEKRGELLKKLDIIWSCVDIKRDKKSSCWDSFVSSLIFFMVGFFFGIFFVNNKGEVLKIFAKGL